MAVTAIHPIKSTPNKALEYIMNPDKTQEEYITGINCSARLAHREFEEVRKFYGKNDKNLQYHLHQSFSDNITPELAHAIGAELAKELFSRHQVVVTTHTDTGHLHNHLMINSVSFIDGYKYNDCDNTYALIRKTSDRICKEHGLDVLDYATVYSRYSNNKGRTEKETDSFHKITDYRNTPTYEIKEEAVQNLSSKIKKDINSVIIKCNNFDEFIDMLKSKGYAVKYGNVKHIAFKAPGQERYRRGCTLGDDYTEDAIKERIDKKVKDLVSIQEEKKPFTSSLDSVNNRDKGNSSSYSTKKKPKLISEVYKYGITDIDALDTLYKQLQYEDGSLVRLPRPLIESILIIDLKETEANRKKLWKTLNKQSSYRAKVNKEREKEFIDRINNNFRQLKFIDKNEITGFDDINNNIMMLDKQYQELHNNLNVISSKLRSMEKMQDIILKYRRFSDKDYMNVNGNPEKLKLMSYCKEFLTSKNLLSRMEQEAFITKLDEFKSDYVMIENKAAIIEKKMKEYDMLVMTLQYIDKHGKNQSSSNFKKYYSLRDNNQQK